MRKNYIIPATEGAQVAATSLMQSASPAANPSMDFIPETGEQW